MADQHGLFWNSESGDRKYGADSFAEWLRHFFTTGVFTGECQVTAAGGMEVSMAAGYANIEGKVRMFDSAETLTIAAANTTYPRIDTVVIRCNYTNREITCDVVQGSYSGSSPSATSPVRTAEMHELVLAEIYVAAGATEIRQSNITDKRADSSVCGIVASTVTQIDFDQIKAQYDSWEEEQQAAFNEWFADIKDTLGSDTAGALKNDIDNVATEVNARPSTRRLATQTLTASGGTLTWTDDAIGDDALIDVYASIPNIAPSAITQSGNVCTVTFDAQDSAFDVAIVVM